MLMTGLMVFLGVALILAKLPRRMMRSEERRVGKEC